MKRFERHAAVSEFLGEAAFVLVRRSGPGALTRRALAAELGVSDSVVRRNLNDEVDLALLALSYCDRQRRVRVRRPLMGRSRATYALDLLLPSLEEVDVEIVWLRLEIARFPAADDLGDGLDKRYQMATRGWVAEAAATIAPERPQHPQAEAIARMFVDHRAERRGLVGLVVPQRPDLVEPLLACADGLLLAVCSQQLEPAAARNVWAAHLRGLGAEPAEDAHPDGRSLSG